MRSGNPRPCTMLSERAVHSSFHCSVPLLVVIDLVVHSYPEQGYTTRQPGILYGWSGRLEQSTTGHSLTLYIINVQKHVQDTSIGYFPGPFSLYD